MLFRTMSRLPKRNLPSAVKSTPDRGAVSESKIGQPKANPKSGFGFQRPSKTPTTPSGKFHPYYLSNKLDWVVGFCHDLTGGSVSYQESFGRPDVGRVKSIRISGWFCLIPPAYEPNISFTLEGRARS